MNKNLNSFNFKKLLVLSIFFVFLVGANNVFAEDNLGDVGGLEGPDAGQEMLEQRSVLKRSPSEEVLGRKLTEAERVLYGDLEPKGIKDALLAKEQRLVIVRALIAVGELNIEKILRIWPVSRLQTFAELVDKFDELKDRYGSVLEGVQSELVFNIKDDEQAFKKAARKAYETVFCVVPDDEDTVQIISFLKENQAVTYSQMVKKIMDTLTMEDKREMLFKTLDKIGRSDLKNNKTFVAKMLAQQFHCENLTKLLQQLAPAKKNIKK